MGFASVRRAELPTPTPVCAPSPRPVPLVIDLDGTLLRTDLLLEGAVSILRRNLFMVFAMLLWLPRGRAYFKRKVAERATLDIATMPSHAELLAHIEAERATGREIVLATAADALMALKVMQAFPVFDRVVASDGIRNLKGEAKALQLAALYPQGFDYAGNAAADLPVWVRARAVIAVEAPTRVTLAARALGKPMQEFPAASRARALVKGLRLHQWAKNGLVFLPLVLGGRATRPPGGWLWRPFSRSASSPRRAIFSTTCSICRMIAPIGRSASVRWRADVCRWPRALPPSSSDWQAAWPSRSRRARRSSPVFSPIWR